MDKENVFVTIGIPVFNEERFIKKAVLSVLIQSYKNFELIITDDASTDHTVDIIKCIKDNRIRLIEGEKNMGIAYRLNQQIELARGKYFFRMDADDLMFPDRLEKQINFLEQNPDVDVVGGLAIVINSDDEIIGIRGKNRICTSIDQLFLFSRFIHPTVMGKIEWFRKWKYRDKYSGCEDFDLWIRSFNNSVFADMPDPLIFYRDPLKLKLKTYLTRRYKVVRCSLSLHKYMESKTLMLRIFLLDFLRSFVAIIFYLIKKDSVFVNRRNKTEIENLDYYESQLKNIKQVKVLPFFDKTRKE